MNTNKERYEKFLAVVREQEFVWNIEPDDLEVVAEFLKARAKVKRMMREATKSALYPSLPDEETPDVA